MHGDADGACRDITVTLAGEGSASDEWTRALRGIEGVTVHRVAAATEPAFIEELALLDIDATVLVTPLADLQGAIRRALAVDRHLLVAGPVALNAQYLATIDASARERRKVAMVDTGSLSDERVAFARRMTGGRQPIWRPRYVRSIRTGDAAATIDELAIAEIHLTLSLLGAVPASVSAVAPRIDDESGAADVAMITLMFEGGPVARIDISLVEPQPRHEVTIACDGRTIVIDSFNARAPLQIQAAGRHRGPLRDSQWAETVLEHPVGGGEDRIVRAAATFVAAVRSEDAAATNAAEIALAARVWERARTSMARWGEPLPLQDETFIERAPALRVIHGRGRRIERRRAPHLTLLASHDREEPLSSA